MPSWPQGWSDAPRRWRDYRTRQREALAESNRLRRDELDALHAQLAGEARSQAEQAEAEASPRSLGLPFLGQGPFSLGFVGALGVLTAVTLWNVIGTLSLTFTLLTVALFLTLALDPLVQRLIRGGLSRGPAVAVVFLGLLVVFALLGSLVLPPVIEQSSALVQNAPDHVDQFLSQKWVQDLDKNYRLTEQIQQQVNAKLTDQSFLSTLAGGIIGAGQAIGSGIFQTFTVLILTLYFLASLPTTKKAAYAVVPASRRARVVYLSEEMMRRVGSYAIGQVGVAAINGTLSWIAMRVLGVSYAEVLAVSVAFLGLIPMVGATLGGALVTCAGLLQSTQTGIILLVYYVVYQQVENYVIVPRIMQRTVAVPGAVTVVAALAGGTMLGMLGALLAIPTAAALLLLYEEVLVPRQRAL